MGLTTYPNWAHGDRRAKQVLQDYCDGVAALVTSGLLDPGMAGAMLDKHGVPFDAQCRIVKEAIHGQQACPDPNQAGDTHRVA